MQVDQLRLPIKYTGVFKENVGLEREENVSRHSYKQISGGQDVKKLLGEKTAVTWGNKQAASVYQGLPFVFVKTVTSNGNVQS